MPCGASKAMTTVQCNHLHLFIDSTIITVTFDVCCCLLLRFSRSYYDIRRVLDRQQL